jgi:hypothetical protein
VYLFSTNASTFQQAGLAGSEGRPTSVWMMGPVQGFSLVHVYHSGVMRGSNVFVLNAVSSSCGAFESESVGKAAPIAAFPAPTTHTIPKFELIGSR